MESINSLDFLNLSKVQKSQVKKYLNRQIKENKNNVVLKNEVIKQKKQIDNLMRQNMQLKKQKTKFNAKLPHFVDDYSPSKPKVDREERLNKKTKFKFSTSNDEIHNKKRTKFDKKALGEAFSESTLTDPFFTRREYDVNSYYHKNVKKHSIGYIITIATPNIDYIKEILNKALLLKFSNTPKEYNLYANIIVKFFFSFLDEEGDKVFVDLYYNSDTAESIKSLNQINEWIYEEGQKINNRVSEIEGCGSDLVFEYIDSITIQYRRTKKTRGAAGYIELPKRLADKKAFINIKNEDDYCIKYNLVLHKNINNMKTKSGGEIKDKNDPRHYKRFLPDIKEPKNIVYPININKDIPKFEELNNIKINIFTYQHDDYQFKTPLTIYSSKSRNPDVCNLLLLYDEKNETKPQHLVYINDICKLFRFNEKDKKNFFCSQCLNAGFISQEKLDLHLNLCMKHEQVKVSLPKKFDSSVEFVINDKGIKVFNDPNKRQDIVKYKNEQNEFKHPYNIVLDFECTLKEVNEYDKDKKTNTTHIHMPNSVGIKFNCIHEEYNKPITTLCNSDIEVLMKECIEKLESETIEAYKLSQKMKSRIVWTKSQKDNFYKSTNCSHCSSLYTKENYKVKHHDHITGKFISSLCNKCNLKFQYQTFIPIYIHNLKGYDSHFLIPYLNKYGTTETFEITCIPNNAEKYISFSKNIPVGLYEKNGEEKMIKFEMRFIDTLAFMASSLSSLAENLNPYNIEIKEEDDKETIKKKKATQIKNEINNVNELRKIYKDTSEHFKDDKQFLLMIKKGIYPYEHINNYDRLLDENIPPIECFYSSLNNSHCSEDDYKHAKFVYKTFNCKSFMEYHKLYLVSDVLLLSDIWRNFKDTCYKIYGLDASYYYTAPGLSWDAMLKHTTEEYKKKKKVFQIELITDSDMDMYLFVEDNIRGGLSQITTRYAEANNKYMKNYSKDSKESYILYLDQNNLYGKSMTSYLPVGDFKWLKKEWEYEYSKELEMEKLNKESIDWILNLKDDDEKGYLFDVDLHYPKSLHDLHNNYPLAPENKVIEKEWLNKWQQKDYKTNKISKLITSFHDKLNYGVSYRLLKLYIQNGLIIKKVNRVLEFRQENFMESYIMKNTTERAKAKNEFEKDFYKLMNNSVYGKTMENVRNRINFRLIASEEEGLRIRSKSKKQTIFNDYLVGIQLAKSSVMLNKPILLGQCILDESKLLMYKFHYNEFLPNFKRENIDLLFTDTDSLCYHIRKPDKDDVDPYDVIKKDKDLYDLSNYEKDNKLYDDFNKKKIGKMKNESPKYQITHFCGLRSKCYSYIKDNGKNENKCKGVKKSVSENHDGIDKCKSLNFKDYQDIVDLKIPKKVIKQSTFTSKKHHISTIETYKTALSCNDDKVYICDDKHKTLSFGHKNIKNVY